MRVFHGTTTLLILVCSEVFAIILCPITTFLVHWPKVYIFKTNTHTYKIKIRRKRERKRSWDYRLHQFIYLFFQKALLEFAGKSFSAKSMYNLGQDFSNIEDFTGLSLIAEYIILKIKEIVTWKHHQWYL